ncbi:MAG: hypothetical protein HXY19_02590 [Thermoanaerobaculaceae bacterium]|nr:hypothetical protein [Thermoanaerobaculaceae bacterium]
MRQVLALAVAGTLLAAGLEAGVNYTAQLEVHHELGAATDTSTVHVWIEGDKAKAEYVETSIPGVDIGDSLLTRDGGATASLVKPGEKTVSPCEVEGVFGILLGSGSKFEAFLPSVTSQAKAELLEKGEGEVVAGRPTVRYKLRVSYLVTRSTRRGDNVTTHVIEQEIWTVEDLPVGSPASWPVPIPLRLKQPEVQAVVAPVVAEVKGLPVKAITTRTATTSEGQERVTHGRFEVVKLEVEEIPEAVFAVPDGFQPGEFRANMFSDPTLRIKRGPR